jgi:hypothetical protein
MFYSLIDIAAVNAFTTYVINFPEWNAKKPNRRRLFLVELGKQLIVPLVGKRCENTNGLKTNTLQAMETIFARPCRNVTQRADTTPKESGGRGRCYRCCDSLSWQNKRMKMSKTTIICANCQRYVCDKHSEKKIICDICKSE